MIFAPIVNCFFAPSKAKGMGLLLFVCMVVGFYQVHAKTSMSNFLEISKKKKKINNKK